MHETSSKDMKFTVNIIAEEESEFPTSITNSDMKSADTKKASCFSNTTSKLSKTNVNFTI